MKDNFQKKGQVQGYKFRVNSIQVIFKPMGMDEITEGGKVERKLNVVLGFLFSCLNLKLLNSWYHLGYQTFSIKKQSKVTYLATRLPLIHLLKSPYTTSSQVASQLVQSINRKHTISIKTCHSVHYKVVFPHKTFRQVSPVSKRSIEGERRHYS